MTIPNVSIPKPVFHVPIVLWYHKISSIHKALLHQMHALYIENGAGIYCTGQQNITLCLKIQSLFILELEWQLQIINHIGKHKTGIEWIMKFIKSLDLPEHAPVIERYKPPSHSWSIWRVRPWNCGRSMCRWQCKSQQHQQYNHLTTHIHPASWHSFEIHSSPIPLKLNK